MRDHLEGRRAAGGGGPRGEGELGRVHDSEVEALGGEKGARRGGGGGACLDTPGVRIQGWGPDPRMGPPKSARVEIPRANPRKF